MPKGPGAWHTSEHPCMSASGRRLMTVDKSGGNVALLSSKRRATKLRQNVCWHSSPFCNLISPALCLTPFPLAEAASCFCFSCAHETRPDEYVVARQIYVKELKVGMMPCSLALRCLSYCSLGEEEGCKSHTTSTHSQLTAQGIFSASLWQCMILACVVTCL